MCGLGCDRVGRRVQLRISGSVSRGLGDLDFRGSCVGFRV